MGNIIGSFNFSLPAIISWLGGSPAVQKAKYALSEIREDASKKSEPLPVSSTVVCEFILEYEKDIGSGLSPFSRKYHCCEGYVVQGLIAQLERELNLLAGERVMVIPNLTLFHMVCLTKQPFLVEKYLKNGVQVNQASLVGCSDEYAGSSPLHLALCELNFVRDPNEKFSTIHVLLKYGADVNNKNDLGNTPLHILFSLSGPIDQQLFKLILETKNYSKVELKMFTATNGVLKSPS